MRGRTSTSTSPWKALFFLNSQPLSYIILNSFQPNDRFPRTYGRHVLCCLAWITFFKRAFPSALDATWSRQVSCNWILQISPLQRSCLVSFALVTFYIMAFVIVFLIQRGLMQNSGFRERSWTEEDFSSSTSSIPLLSECSQISHVASDPLFLTYFLWLLCCEYAYKNYAWLRFSI
jgi:hypothetical protein